MEGNKLHQTVGIAFIFIVYVGVRGHGLTTSCLWFDEIFGVDAAQRSWTELVNFVAADLVHPPLFYALLKVWISAVGDSVFALRLFPFLISVFALLPFYLLCRELKLKTWTLLFALFLFSVNGSAIKYAQEVRMYSLLLFISLISMWLFARFCSRGTGIWLLGLINIALVYTHYYGWLIIAAEALFVILYRREKSRFIVAMLLIDIAAFAPWIVTIWRAAAGGSDLGQNISWIGRPGARGLFELVLDIVEPFYFQQSSAEPASIYFLTLPVLASLIVAAVFCIFESRRTKLGEPLLFGAVFITVPLFLAFLLSWLLPYSIWGTRHLIVILPAAWIAIAAMLSRIEHRWLSFSLTGVLVAAAAIGFVVKISGPPPTFVWCTWGPAAVAAAQGGADEIYVFEDIVAYHAWFATRNFSPSPRIIKVDGVPGIAEDAAYFLPRGFDLVQRKSLREIDGQRITIMFRAPALNVSEPPLRNLIMMGYMPERSDAYGPAGQQTYVVGMVSSR